MKVAFYLFSLETEICDVIQTEIKADKKAI